MPENNHTETPVSRSESNVTLAREIHDSVYQALRTVECTELEESKYSLKATARQARTLLSMLELVGGFDPDAPEINEPEMQEIVDKAKASDVHNDLDASLRDLKVFADLVSAADSDAVDVEHLNSAGSTLFRMIEATQAISARLWKARKEAVEPKEIDPPAGTVDAGEIETSGCHEIGDIREPWGGNIDDLNLTFERIDTLAMAINDVIMSDENRDILSMVGMIRHYLKDAHRMANQSARQHGEIAA